MEEGKGGEKAEKRVRREKDGTTKRWFTPPCP